MTEVITAIITAIISPTLVLILTDFYKRKNRPYKTPKNIKEHPFFAEVKYMIEISIPKICIPDNVKKTKLIRKFLKIKFQAIESNFLSLADKVEKREKICNTLYSFKIMKIIKEYEAESERQNIPDVFIRKFSQWHTPKIDLILETIDYITRSNIYDADAEKLSAVLDIILMTLHLTLMDTERVIADMNGELSKILDKQKET
jgi:hypothetical protein